MKKLITTLVLAMTLVSAAMASSVTEVTLEWTDFSSEYSSFSSNAAKEQLVEHAKEDAMEFIATEGLETTSLLSVVMDNYKHQNSEVEADDMEIAKGLVRGDVEIVIVE
jgi:uncharacterized protein (TIGR02448 family)